MDRDASNVPGPDLFTGNQELKIDTIYNEAQYNSHIEKPHSQSNIVELNTLISSQVDDALNCTNFQHNSPKSVSVKTEDSSSNMNASYTSFPDKPPSTSESTGSLLRNNGKLVSHSPSNNNVPMGNRLAGAGSAASEFHSFKSPDQEHLVVGDYSDEVFILYVTGLEHKQGAKLSFTKYNELSSFEMTERHYVHLLLDLDHGPLSKLESAIEAVRHSQTNLNVCAGLSFHLVFPLNMKWASASKAMVDLYDSFFNALKEVAGHNVHQCSILRKYDSSTVYITEIDALVALGKEITSDVSRWDQLKVLDYSHNCLRLLPGVKFPDTLELLNIGGCGSLETLAGFKMPSNLRVLDVSNNQLKSVDYAFPAGLRRLVLQKNAIYSLDYVNLPQQLTFLDLSHNRIDSIQYVNFPRELTHLLLAYNPIDSMKGARFPEKIKYLDLSCIPNESLAGIKFPDSTDYLNLQLSMTNTRGLKLPPYVKELNMACDGVNSINPLKLPNSIEKLFLANNNIKTLSKVTFPTALKELYLGNNLITTLKNVLFPLTLEVLDLEMNPDLEDNEKDISSLKDVVFPQSLRILRLGYHLIKAVEGLDFPYNLEELSLQYNDLRMFRNVKFGPKLRMLDLSGNQELMSVDNVLFPDTLQEMKIPSTLLSNLPADIVRRANNRELILIKSLPYTI